MHMKILCEIAMNNPLVLNGDVRTCCWEGVKSDARANGRWLKIMTKNEPVCITEVVEDNVLERTFLMLCEKILAMAWFLVVQWKSVKDQCTHVDQCTCNADGLSKIPAMCDDTLGEIQCHVSNLQCRLSAFSRSTKISISSILSMYASLFQRDWSVDQIKVSSMSSSSTTALTGCPAYTMNERIYLWIHKG